MIFVGRVMVRCGPYTRSSDVFMGHPVLPRTFWIFVFSQVFSLIFCGTGDRCIVAFAGSAVPIFVTTLCMGISGVEAGKKGVG